MCDRCGHEVKLKSLIEEWTGLKVCKKCLDPKTALEFPGHFPIDAEAIKDPRPDNDVEAGDGTVTISGLSLGGTFKTPPVRAELGTVTVSITP